MSTSGLHTRSSQQRNSPQPIVASQNPANVHYTTIIRLPFPRGSFQEPDRVQWDSSKDAALWSIISSKGSNPKDLDWQNISETFEVNLSFLMMQAAWLYERHFEGVRKQMAMLGGVASGGQDDIEQRKDVKSLSVNTSQRAASSSPGGMGSTPDTPRKDVPPLSRTASTNTVTQSRVFTPTSRQSFNRPFRTSGSYQRRTPQPPHDPSDSSPDEPQGEQVESGQPGASSRGMSSSKAPTKAPTVGRTPVAPPVTSSNDGSLDNIEDDDGSSSGGFLPFAAAAGTKTSKTSTKPIEDPTATLRDSPKCQQRVVQPTQQAAPDDSSASSASSAQQPEPSTGDTDRKAPGPLSPKHRAKLAQQMSPRRKREGDSEGTPSMGSSFSDLDDASVTRSALEDALMSNMQGNASLASRVSGIGSAFRSRYS